MNKLFAVFFPHMSKKLRHNKNTAGRLCTVAYKIPFACN